MHLSRSVLCCSFFILNRTFCKNTDTTGALSKLSLFLPFLVGIGPMCTFIAIINFDPFLFMQKENKVYG